MKVDKQMKRVVTTLLLLCVCMCVKPDTYKILYINHQRLWINGKEAKVGDTFDDNAVVRWSAERQAMRVYNSTCKKQMLMVANSLTSKGSTVKDILTARKHLSTYSHSGVAGPSLYQLLQGMFENHYDMMGAVEIPCPDTLDITNGYFRATYQYGDTRITQKLHRKEGFVSIDNNLFGVGEKQLEPHDIVIDIDYVDESNGSTIFVKAGVRLYIVPEAF